MKKITKYLIIPLFSLFAFFLFFNIKASATGVLVPDDGSGDVSVVPPISGEELYEQCHTYITTNIISAESLTEALNGKIYGNFTQEDCMEMINIASKREVIKNLFDINNCEWSNQAYFENDMLYVISTGGNGGYTVCNKSINVEYLEYFSVRGEYEKGTFRFIVRSYDKNNNIIQNGLSGINNYNVIYGGQFNDGYSTFQIIDSNVHYIKLGFVALDSGTISGNYYYFKNIQIEKGRTITPYVSYDYHREYYQEGIDYADGRVNTNSTSYTQGVTDADNRVNTDSVNYKTGEQEGYQKATKDGKSLGTFIPNLLGGFGSFFLTILNIDILGFNLLTVFGIIVAVAGVIIILKIVRG